MNMSIHKVKEIRVTASRDLKINDAFIRNLIVMDDKGNEFQLDLFAQDIDNLTIKSEI
tara:strand:- start:1116 stop:1289 length:174 start_codon:yes stop_codon:yes gene_type:complete